MCVCLGVSQLLCVHASKMQMQRNFGSRSAESVSADPLGRLCAPEAGHRKQRRPFGLSSLLSASNFSWFDWVACARLHLRAKCCAILVRHQQAKQQHRQLRRMPHILRALARSLLLGRFNFRYSLFKFYFRLFYMFAFRTHTIIHEFSVAPPHDPFEFDWFIMHYLPNKRTMCSQCVSLFVCAAFLCRIQFGSHITTCTHCAW